MHLSRNWLANPPTSYRSLSLSLGPKSPKSLKKSQKLWKKSRKSPEQTFSRLFLDFSDFFKTFSRLLGTPGPEAPGHFFQTFCGFRARRARETPVARGRVRKNWPFGNKTNPHLELPGLNKKEAENCTPNLSAVVCTPMHSHTSDIPPVLLGSP